MVLRDVWVIPWLSGLGDLDALCSGRYECQETWAACQKEGVNPNAQIWKMTHTIADATCHLEMHSLRLPWLSQHSIVFIEIAIMGILQF